MDDTSTDLKAAGPAVAKPKAGRQDHYDVFISYRRSGGSELATLIDDKLSSRGYRVFLDVGKMPSGPFDESLAKLIELATDVVIVLTPGSLVRSANKQDWFFEEISLALRIGKNVVPVKPVHYDLPTVDSLPESVRPLIQQHMCEYVHGKTKAAMDDLCRLLHSKPRRRISWRAALLAALVAVIGTAAVFAWVALHPAESLPPKLEVFQLSGDVRMPVTGPALLPNARLLLAPKVAKGWLPYILEVKGDGTAQVYSPKEMADHKWQLQIDVPHISETILLLASDHTITDVEKNQIEKSITDLALKPKVALRTETEWSPDGASPVPTMTGYRGLPDVVDSDWQARLLSSLQSLKGISFRGISLPIINPADADIPGPIGQ